ncbi:MAG: DNA polymerase III subunit gamma/tau, partial [Clostridia bacterium]|nr:DNA polymerase III subunit gamma/tau [Clostridia bacterium]
EECEACRLIESGAATDVIEMDAASNNGVDNIRDIRDEVVYTPSNLKYRVYIIDEVHMLSASAFNALLKTLEEPPEHVVFILATTELHKLPATIVSRCQRFDFRRITTEILKDHLLRIAKKEGIDITDSAARLLAKHAQGGMRDAISLLDLCAGSRRLIDDALVADTVGLGGREKMLSVVRSIAEKDNEAIFAVVDETVQSSRDITVFWQELISVYRDILIVKTAKEPARYLDLTDSETAALSSVAKLFSVEQLSYHSQLLNDAYPTMLRANAVKRIVAEMTLVRMCDARLSSSPEAMLSRIAALERGLASGALQATATEKVTEPIAPETKAERPVRKAIKNSASDEDEMFKSDAPVTAKASAPTTVRKAEPISQRQEAGQKVRTLKPFKNRAEAIEIMDTRSAMLASFFKCAKWYSDGEGNIVLKYETQYQIDNMKMFDGEPFFVSVISQVTGSPFTLANMKCECDSEKKGNDIIDKIIEAAEDV